MTLRALPAVATLAVALAFSPKASAVPQRMVFNDESTTLAKGVGEFETTIAWDHASGADTLIFKHEVEWGLTDNLEFDVYLSEWEWSKVRGEGSHATWGSAGAELIYSFTNPSTDVLGSAISVETQFGANGLFELEPALRLQKNLGKLTVIYSGGITAGWDNDGNYGELFQHLGATYQITPQLFVGANLSYGVAYPEWSHGENELYLGPTVHFRTGKVWFTAECGFKLTADASDAADIHAGLRFGFNF